MTAARSCSRLVPVTRAILASAIALAGGGCGGSSDSYEEITLGRYTADVSLVGCGETTGLTTGNSATRYCTVFFDVAGPAGAVGAVAAGNQWLVVAGRDVPADAVTEVDSDFKLSFTLDDLDDSPSHLVLELDGESARIPVHVEESGLDRPDQELRD